MFEAFNAFNQRIINPFQLFSDFIARVKICDSLFQSP